MGRVFTAGVAALCCLAAATACSGSTGGSGSRASSAVAAPSGSGTPAAAGSSGELSTASGSSGAAASPSLQYGATASGTDATRLAAVVVQPRDLPPGWVPKPYTPDPNDAATQAALLQCVGGRSTDADKVGEAHAPDFSRGTATVTSQAARYTSQADVDADVAMLHSPKLSGCYDQVAKTKLAAGLPAGASVQDASIQIVPGPGGGPSNVAATGSGTVTLAVNGQLATVYLNVAFITGPQLEAEIDYVNLGASVPTALWSSLIGAVAKRAATA